MKKITILKSMRTQEGATDYLARFKNKFPEGAVVIKGMLDGEISYGDSCSPSSVYPGGGQIVVYETMTEATKHVGSDDVDAFVKALLDKDLVELSGSGLHVSNNMYDLLSDFSKRIFERGLKHKSITGAGALAQAIETQDVEGGKKDSEEEKAEEEKELRKSISETLIEVIKAMSEKEASNIDQGNVGISDAEAFKETKNKIKDPKAPEQPTTPEPAPEGDLSQEDASNHKGDTRTEAISDKYPVDSENDIENSKGGSKPLFKSLMSAREWQHRNTDYEVQETTFQEKLENGRRYLYKAVKKPKAEPIGAFGNRKINRH